MLFTEIPLDVYGLRDTIKERNKASTNDKAKAIIFISQYFHEELKFEYLTVRDPFFVWKIFKKRYDKKKTIILPKAGYDWMHLRIQDFKSINEYNSAIFRISSKHNFGEKIILMRIC